jgi:pimeloyl-ACP methyl ester carboxylesterase
MSRGVDLPGLQDHSPIFSKKGNTMYRIESLLSARLFLAPQLFSERIYFISNLSGRMSLYAMDAGGSVPEPLLPPNIALQNPDLIGGHPFQVFPGLGKILVMLDQDGDENYLPTLIPIDEGFPEPIFVDQFAQHRVHLIQAMPDEGIVYFNAESRDSALQKSYRANLISGELVQLAQSQYGAFPAAISADHHFVVISDGYTMGDEVLFLREEGKEGLRLLSGIPLEERKAGQEVPLTGINSLEFTNQDRGLLALCAVFSDTYAPAYLDLANPQAGFVEVRMTGVRHSGTGEMIELRPMQGDRYAASFNIDGCSWLYEAHFDPSSLTLTLEQVLVGERQPLVNGKMESFDYVKNSDCFVLAFSTATSPTQIFTVSGPNRDQVVMHTHEKVLGISPELLSPGEDASFVSYDGMRISARLYLPAPALKFKGPRPLVYYVHGGPQSQERPDFAWFSMPLIQYLTLNGFAVFVPNVRGSTGYGLTYTKQVDHDWGGKDRLDHVHALKLLSADPRVDAKRAGVVGRSYGGYMTLTLAGRHPELWLGAVDMFGPFDLFSFMERLPATWKPYFHMSVGHPEKDRDFLIERSPRTHIQQMTCPMLVIQGKNDPRVTERESSELVEILRGQGKQVDYLMFENEGHDVLKYENRVRCYVAITEFFKQCLN